jgi:hypothetical protein
MKAVGSFFGERPVLKLMYAVLIRAPSLPASGETT